MQNANWGACREPSHVFGVAVFVHHGVVKVAHACHMKAAMASREPAVAAELIKAVGTGRLRVAAEVGLLL